MDDAARRATTSHAGRLRCSVRRLGRPACLAEALKCHREDIRRIVAEHRACNPRVFGSVLHGSDLEGSDLDILVDGTPETSLLDLARIERHLCALLGVPVDVRTPLDLPRNFRDLVVTEARPI